MSVPRELRRPTRLLPECANCGEPLAGPDAVTRGPDTAWHFQCQECYELSAHQLELTGDQPGGAPIRIYRCLRCRTTRSCQPGWHTRCHVCLDERSIGPAVTNAGRALLAGLGAYPDQRHTALTPPTAEQIRRAVEASSLRALADVLRSAERPTWEILATDVYGLPWGGAKTGTSSHGTWGRHKECGTVAKLHPGAADCPTCGPEPDSRTDPAKRSDPYLLYLVTHRRRQKFGVGDRRRIETHLHAGATLVQVLQAPFTQVLLAENALKRQYHQQIPRRLRRVLIDSFGQATVVIRRKVLINLADVLPDGEDVTHWFR